MQRSLRLFQNSVGSQETAKQYKWYLDRFIKFYKLRDYDSLLTMELKQIQIIVEDYVMDLKNNLNPNSIPSYTYPILPFFEANDIELKSKKIKRLFPTEIKKSGNKAYTTSDIKKILEHTPSLRNKCIVLFFASTGCRIGALEDLKFRDLTSMPNNYKDVKVGLHRLDFILDGKLVLELKAWASITSSHVGQTTAYLKTLKLHHGILVNFPYPEKDSPDFKELVL